MYCSVCGEELSRETKELELASHTAGEAVEENRVESTCTVAGSYDSVVYCSVCGEELSRETKSIAATGHSYGEWSETKAATCMEVGEERRDCQNCDHFETQEIAINASAHTGNNHTENAKDATCSAEGYTGDTVCECGVTVANGTAISKLAHTEETIPGKAATCNETGLTEGKECTVCGTVTVAQEEIPTIAHSYDAVVTLPTCELTGYTTYTCACGDSFVSDYVTALGHSYENGVCTVCGTKEFEYLQGYNKTVYQIGLIEPWAMKINVRVTDASYTTIDYTTVKDYGVYAIRRGLLSDPNMDVLDMTIEFLKNEENAIHYTMEEGTAVQSGNYITFIFSEGLFTYRLKEDVVWVAYYETEDGIYATPVQQRNLYDLMYSRKDSLSSTYSAEEKAVYADMVELYAKITDYRSDFDTLTDSVPQDTATLANTDILFGDATTDGKYGFARVQQIGLIEPWGMRLNTRIYSADNTSGYVDYDALTDFGVIVFHDKAGTIDAENLNEVGEFLNIADKENTYVFSDSQNTTTVSGKYAASIFNEAIYTYQLDSTVYYMFFAQDGENFYYSQVYATNIRTLAAERSVSTSTTYTEKEKATYAAMVELCDSIAQYHKWYWENVG